MSISKDRTDGCSDKKFPFSLSFVITHECNLRCVYCYESNRDNCQPNAELIKTIISQYLSKESLKEVYIDFFGGEPWLKFDLIKDVCEWTWSKSWPNKYIFFTTTNGTMVHGKIKEWLRKHKAHFWCGLSLDGRKSTHDKNRSNSFDKIDKDFFLECWPEQTIKMTISKYSIETLYEDIIYIQKLGFKLAGTNFAEGIDWSAPKYVGILCRELEKLTQFYIEHPEFDIAPILNIPIQNCEHKPKTRKWCGTGGNMALYDIDGQMYPCQFFTPMSIEPHEFAKVKDLDFRDESLFLDQDCFEHCYFHNICSNCYGANFLKNGRMNQRDHSKCNLVKVRAYYAAALIANRLLQNNGSFANPNTAALQIRAIEKIKKQCESDLGLK